jgi:hypothetical protein
VIRNKHEGPGVVPGRYVGEAIPIHNGPTPEQIAYQEAKAHADALAGRICVAAAETARCQSTLLDLLGEFDAVNGLRHWTGFKSVAHWLSWSCSMTLGVAREHVRVATALRRMPTIAGLFKEGRLSYSKVREVTRVVDVVDEQRLAELAVTATAAQLAKMISSFRGIEGRRIPQQNQRVVSWQEREDGMIHFRVRLPKEEAAVLVAAIDVARDQFGPPPPTPGPCSEPQPDPTGGPGVYRKADALLDVARAFINTAPEDRSGEDRGLVVVHVSADNLAGDVPAGTSQPSRAVCTIDGVGSVEPATAQKLACDNPVLGAVVDKHGQVLALGRTRRLVSKPLRRALMIRDCGMCQYPGCHQTRHLKAHHLLPWMRGGRTDLANLILLCQWHHTAVHEGGVTITGHSGQWLFTKPDGQSCQPWLSDENLARHLDFARRRAEQETAQGDQLAAVDSFHHPDATTIRPRWKGEPFDLHACVQALFTIKLPEPTDNQDQQAA